MNPGGLSDWRGHVSTGMGRANSLFLACFWMVDTGTTVPLQAGAVPTLWPSSVFLAFSHHIRTITYKTNGNKTKEIKQINPWVASHEALFYHH